MTVEEMQTEAHARLRRIFELLKELQRLGTLQTAMTKDDPDLDARIDAARWELRDCRVRIDTLVASIRLALGLDPDTGLPDTGI
jgi:hypothetical protein